MSHLEWQLEWIVLKLQNLDPSASKGRTQIKFWDSKQSKSQMCWWRMVDGGWWMLDGGVDLVNLAGTVVSIHTSRKNVGWISLATDNERPATRTWKQSTTLSPKVAEYSFNFFTARKFVGFYSHGHITVVVL